MTSPLPLQPIDEAPGTIYDLTDEVGARRGLPGGGIHAYFTGQPTPSLIPAGP